MSSHDGSPFVSGWEAREREEEKRREEQGGGIVRMGGRSGASSSCVAPVGIGRQIC